MNRFLLMTSVVVFSCCFAGCFEVKPNTSGGPGGIRTNNVNTTNENSQIRLWILTEEQIANPPTTKMQAMQLQSFVQPRFRAFTFNRNPGSYYVVASNESHFQSLGNSAAFRPGVDFSALKILVRQELVPVSVRNSATPTRLPVITGQ